MHKRLIWEQPITMTLNNLWMQNSSFFGEPIRLGLLLIRCTLSNRQRKKEQSLLLSIRYITQTASKADEYIQINSSTDGAMALGIIRYIMDHKLYDAEWVKSYSLGFNEFVAYVKNNITVE